MSKKSYFRIHNIKNDSDVKVTWQYVPTTIVCADGTIPTDDRVCVSMTDLEGKTLNAFFTAELLDRFILQLTQCKNELERRHNERLGIQPPF